MDICWRSPTAARHCDPGRPGSEPDERHARVGIAATPSFVRFLRSACRGAFSEYGSSRVIGANGQAIVLRHVLPNIRQAIVTTTLNMASAIGVGAPFLGLSARRRLRVGAMVFVADCPRRPRTSPVPILAISSRCSAQLLGDGCGTR
jgi:ABC-type dipeptide/oligopeptide/nickel transport system permease subunit